MPYQKFIALFEVDQYRLLILKARLFTFNLYLINTNIKMAFKIVKPCNFMKVIKNFFI